MITIPTIAQQLRELAAIYWREAEKQTNPQPYRLQAAALHAQALKIEAGVQS